MENNTTSKSEQALLKVITKLVSLLSLLLFGLLLLFLSEIFFGRKSQFSSTYR